MESEKERERERERPADAPWSSHWSQVALLATCWLVGLSFCQSAEAQLASAGP